MPKEIAHIKLAQLVLDRLSPDSIFYKPILTYPHLFLLGSIAPDAPYFYVIGPHNSFIQSLALKLHTTNNSSALPLLEFADQTHLSEADALSFLAGVATHIMADTTFHPLVYYYAGMDNLHKGATNRHRLFETAMDYYFWGLLHQKSKIDLVKQRNQHKINTQRLCKFFQTLFLFQKDKRKKYIIFAYRAHLFFQWVFQNRTLYKVFAFLNIYNLGIRQADFSLCYPLEMNARLHFFENELHFLDPCRGIVFNKTMDELSDTMVHHTIQVLDILEKQLINRSVHKKVLNHFDLPEIRPCLSPNKDRFKYWHKRHDLYPLLFENVTYPSHDSSDSSESFKIPL